MNPYVALGVQLAVVVALPGLVWLFRAALGSKIEEIVKDTKRLADAAAEQAVHNARHDAQTGYIIDKVDDIDDRVTSLEQEQRKTNVRQVLIGTKLKVDFGEYDGH